MSGIQVVINGLPQNLTNSLMQSLVILSTGLDQNANTTLNNIDIQKFSDGGNIKIGELAMNSQVNHPITNIAIGYEALPKVDGSLLESDNIAIGRNSLYDVTTGGKNIGIGLNALGSLSTQTNTIGIGNNTNSSASNGIIIGNNVVLTNNNSGMLKFNSITNNISYPASNEFWFGDPTTGWIDTRIGNAYVQNLDIAGSLSTNTLSLNKLQVTSDTGELDILVRDSAYNNTLNKIDEIRNTASFRNKYGPIAFIADVSGILASATDPILREKILFGYQQGTKAIEINSYGAISLDTINSTPLNSITTLTSNYGTTGQVIMSQGSTNNAKWSNVTDISGIIGLTNRNINGIAYIRDTSGNLDSSSNFIFDGSGIILIGTKTATFPMLRLTNNGTSIATKTQFVIANPTTIGTSELKSSTYQQTTNSIDETVNSMVIKNSSGDIALIPGSTKKILLGYNSGGKAFEINSYGAISFDTSGNNNIPLTFTSNYGNLGQIISSQGSGAPPKWTNITDLSGFITTVNKNIGGVAFIKDALGNLDTSSNFFYDASGLLTLIATEAIDGLYPRSQINIDGSGNANLWGLAVKNSNGGTLASSNIRFYNDSGNFAWLSYRSSNFSTALPLISNYPNAFLIRNNSGPVVLQSSNNILFGYSGSSRAVEIASSGAMSFDTSNNAGTWVSNFGLTGQILSSQGSGAPPKWITNTGSGITMSNPNIGGIGYVIDASGNLDSSSNFVYDGSGINITNSKNAPLYGLQIQNTNTGGTATTDLILRNNTTNVATLELKSTGYTSGTTIDAKSTILSIGNLTGSININSGDKTLFGYQTNTKAIEINNLGAMSFDTSNNSGTWVSNYGLAGQILSSQGVSAPPKWITNTGGGGITMANANIGGIGYVIDTSGNLDSTSKLTYDGSGVKILGNVSNNPITLLSMQNTKGNSQIKCNMIDQLSHETSFIFNSNDYQNVTNLIDQGINTLTLKNAYGAISLIPDSTNTIPTSYQKILLGYQSGAKAVEINSYGAMSFDTSGNNDIAQTFTSNYGLSGQILSSQGSNAPPKWITNTGGGGIIMANTNIGGIGYVIDTSGNLDSSSNFVYDGSGLTLLTKKTGNQNVLTLGNTLPADGTSQTNIILKNSSSGSCFINYKADSFNNVTNTIAESRNNFSLQCESGDIALIPSGAKKILLGYQSGSKAFEVNNLGSISFDTYGNNNTNLTFTSNYGISGEQIMISQGSNAPPKWGSITDLSGGITTFSRNVGGVAYIKDASGNLDSSSNFIYDGSGINILSSKNSTLYGLSIQNTSTGGSATTNITLKNSTNTSTLELKGDHYTSGTTINAKANIISLTNSVGSISTNSFDKTLFGYASNTRAVEIASSGAISFDTSNNNGTWISNYGIAGQVLTSQGTTAPPKWDTSSSFSVNPNNILFSTNGVDISGNSGLTYSNNILSISDISANTLNLEGIIYDWSTVTPGSYNLYDASIDITISGTNIVIADTSGYIYTATNILGPYTLDFSGNPGLQPIHCATSNSNIISAELYGDIWAKINGTWSIQSGGASIIPSGLGFVSVDIYNTTMIACAFNNNNIWINTTGTWVDVSNSILPQSPNWKSVGMSNNNTNMIACGNLLGVFYNFGSGWVNSGLSSLYLNACAISGTNMIVACYGGLVYYNFGSGWIDTGLPNLYWSNVSIDGTDMVAVGHDAHSFNYVYINYGNGWINYSNANVFNNIPNPLYTCSLSNRQILSTNTSSQLFTNTLLNLSKGQIVAKQIYLDGFGMNGQVLKSNGSSSAMSWNDIPTLNYANSAQYASDISGSPLTLISPLVFTGLGLGRKRIVTFTTSIVIYTNTTITYILYVNDMQVSTMTMRTQINTPVQHTMIFNYSNYTTSDTIYITATAPGDVNVNTSDSYSLRFEQL